MKWVVIYICVAGLGLIIHPAHAQQQDFTPDFMACAGIENPPLRYACFDKTAGIVRDARQHQTAPGNSVSTTENKPDSALVNTITKPRSKKRRFGFLPTRKPVTKQKDFGMRIVQAPAAEITQITQNINSFELDHRGKVTVTLTNGQVWRQISGDTSSLTKARMRRQNSVEIKQAAIGSYLMVLKPARKSIRVRRVK